MKLNKLYSEEIIHLPYAVMERVIREAPHTSISKPLPDELQLLNGSIIDLGFENLGLTLDELHSLERQFISGGVCIPDTKWKLRYARSLTTVVELAEAADTYFLPSYWVEGVLVMGYDDRFTWIGKRVRDDQIIGVSLSDYNFVDNGYILKK